MASTTNSHGGMMLSGIKKWAEALTQLSVIWRLNSQFGGRSSKWRTLEVGQMASPTFSNSGMMISGKKKWAERF